ncbi:MAG: SMP-30/gluconolactonase/LRE family protein [Rhodopila sp.]
MLPPDVSGNLWLSSSAVLGYSGVLVLTPAGKLLGRIRLPEVCANLTFGGPKRNMLFMCASQSLYLLQVQTQGAAPGQTFHRPGPGAGSALGASRRRPGAMHLGAMQLGAMQLGARRPANIRRNIRKWPDSDYA